MEEYDFGTEVRVNLAGRVVGGSDFPEPAYLIEFERNGELKREWVAVDKVERVE